MKIPRVIASLSVLMALPQGAGAQDARQVAISVDAGKAVGKLPPVWHFFGADEPNYATMKDGRKLLVELGELKRGRSISVPITFCAAAMAPPPSNGAHQRLYRDEGWQADL